jgi:DNA polymerase-3 subunit gamma/tau
VSELAHHDDPAARDAAPAARESLAARHRPHCFADVVGQRHAVAVLRPLAANPPQQILLTGGSGLGKTTLARVFAAAVNCESPVDGDACGSCPSCVDIAAGTHPDVVELDAASNGGKDEIRDIATRAMTAPLRSQYRIYVIDEAHGITRAGGEAFLMLLERPPPHVVFVLATTDPDKMLITNRGRCLELELLPPTRTELLEHLVAVAAAEGVELDVDQAATVLDATDPRTGVRGTLMNLAKVLVALGHGDDAGPDAVRRLLGLAPAAGLDALIRALAALDRPAAFAALEAARTDAADAAVRAGLVSWARRELRATATDPSAFAVARWRFDRLMTAPPGETWTDLVVAYLCDPLLDPDPEALVALQAEGRRIAGELHEAMRLANQADRGDTQRPSPTTPAPDTAGLDTDEAATDKPATDKADDGDRRDSSGPPPDERHSPPMDEPPMDEPPMDEPPMDEPPMDEPPMDEPPMDEPPMDEPPMDEPPAPPRRPSASVDDPWFDNPDARETTPASATGRSEAPPRKSPARKAAPKKASPRPAASERPAPPRPRTATGPPPAPASAPTAEPLPADTPQRLRSALDTGSPNSNELLGACLVTVDGPNLVVSVPIDRVGEAREPAFQQAVREAAATCGIGTVSWRKHRPQ